MSSDGNSEPSTTPEPKSEEDEDVERDSRTPRCCSLRYRRDLRRAKKALKRLRREVNVVQVTISLVMGILRNSNREEYNNSHSLALLSFGFQLFDSMAIYEEYLALVVIT